VQSDELEGFDNLEYLASDSNAQTVTPLSSDDHVEFSGPDFTQLIEVLWVWKYSTYYFVPVPFLIIFTFFYITHHNSSSSSLLPFHFQFWLLLLLWPTLRVKRSSRRESSGAMLMSRLLIHSLDLHCRDRTPRFPSTVHAVEGDP
jgi:hypothetical protein